MSIVLPAFNEENVIAGTIEAMSDYLEGTGLSWEIIAVDDGSTDETLTILIDLQSRVRELRVIQLERNRGKGAAVRAGVLEARGAVIGFTDADQPYRFANLGEAIALVHSGATDIAIGARDLAESEHDDSYPFVRHISGRLFSLIVGAFLIRGIPDTQCGLKVFSSSAASMIFRQGKIDSFGFDFETLYLAQKYGFRIARIPVGMTHRHESKVSVIRDSLRMLRDLMRVRLNDRYLRYRAAPPCPVCLSIETWSLTQIEDRVVRHCRRCKCRYLAQFPDPRDLRELYESGYYGSVDPESVGYGERDDDCELATAQRRAKALRGTLPAGARVLEIGCGLGHFGLAIRDTYEFEGVDLSITAIERSRELGLNVVRADVETYVSTSGTFDAIAAFHVIEHLLDPHMALEKMRGLLKPGGLLLLATPDTESVLCSISGDRWVSYKFPEHVILYSRSALLELLEQNGFEILTARSDLEYHRSSFIESRLDSLNPLLAALARPVLRLLPEPIPITSGSVLILARKTSSPRITIPAPVRVPSGQVR